MLAALKSTEAMRERAEKMFLSKPDGPHHSDLFTVGMCKPTNSVLEVVHREAISRRRTRDAQSAVYQNHYGLR